MFGMKQLKARLLEAARVIASQNEEIRGLQLRMEEANRAINRHVATIARQKDRHQELLAYQKRAPGMELRIVALVQTTEKQKKLITTQNRRYDNLVAGYNKLSIRLDEITQWYSDF